MSGPRFVPRPTSEPETLEQSRATAVAQPKDVIQLSRFSFSPELPRAGALEEARSAGGAKVIALPIPERDSETSRQPEKARESGLISRFTAWGAEKIEQVKSAAGKFTGACSRAFVAATATAGDCISVLRESVSKVWNAQGGFTDRCEVAWSTLKEAGSRLSGRCARGAKEVIAACAEAARAAVEIVSPALPQGAVDFANSAIDLFDNYLNPQDQDFQETLEAMEEAELEVMDESLDRAVEAFAPIVERQYAENEQSLSFNAKLIQALEVISSDLARKEAREHDKAKESIELAREHRAELLKDKLSLLSRHPWLQGTSAAAAVQTDHYVLDLPEQQILQQAEAEIERGRDLKQGLRSARDTLLVKELEVA